MKKARPTNNIRKLREERNLSSAELADMIGTSRPHMSRLENAKSPLDADWILKISGALKVPTNEVADIPISKSLTTMSDDTLLGSVLGWLFEANEQYKTKLSPAELSHWATFVYKKAGKRSYNAQYVQDLAFTVVEVLKQCR